VHLSGFSVPLVDTAYLTGEEEPGGTFARWGNFCFNIPCQGWCKLVQTVFRLHQFFLEFLDPPGMGKITRPDNGDPFFLGPEGKMFRIKGL